VTSTSSAPLSDFVSLAETALKPYLQDRGLLVYSSVATLRRDNPVVYWGFNPGQDPLIEDPTHWTIRQAISQFPSQMRSLIDDQCWPKAGRKPIGKGGYTHYHDKGEAPYQRGVRYLLDFIGHEGALVANLFFFQTSREGHLKPNRQQVDSCWLVHRFLLETIKPRVLITTVGVVSALRRFKLADLEGPIEQCDSGYSNWKCALYKNLDGFPAVIAAPHMSYWGRWCKNDTMDTKYGPALRWIKERVDRFTQ
jgi:hypothetical protein